MTLFPTQYGVNNLNRKFLVQASKPYNTREQAEELKPMTYLKSTRQCPAQLIRLEPRDDNRYHRHCRPVLGNQPAFNTTSKLFANDIKDHTEINSPK